MLLVVKANEPNGHAKYDKADMIRYYFKLIVLLLFANNTINAQVDSSQQSFFDQIYSAAEKEYGIHQELINGVLFEDKNQDIIGHPYLLNYYSNQGSILYRGKHYSNLSLRYDIQDQKVLLIYLFKNVAYKLILHKEFISEFNIENKKFINAAFYADEDAKFYQVFGKDFPIRILFFWQKGISNVYVNNTNTKTFSSEQKKSFILLNNELASYKGNKSFIRNFSSKSKIAIKKYFRENKIKVKHASDHEIELLISFINTLNN